MSTGLGLSWRQQGALESRDFVCTCLIIWCHLAHHCSPSKSVWNGWADFLGLLNGLNRRKLTVLDTVLVGFASPRPEDCSHVMSRDIGFTWMPFCSSSSAIAQLYFVIFAPMLSCPLRFCSVLEQSCAALECLCDTTLVPGHWAFKQWMFCSWFVLSPGAQGLTSSDTYNYDNFFLQGQVWLKDKEATHCKLCEKEFSLSKRKVKL